MRGDNRDDHVLFSYPLARGPSSSGHIRRSKRLHRQSRSHAGTNGYSDRHSNAGADCNSETDACTHSRKRQCAGAGGNFDHDPGEHSNAGADCNGDAYAYTTHARNFIVSA